MSVVFIKSFESNGFKVIVKIHGDFFNLFVMSFENFLILVVYCGRSLLLLSYFQRSILIFKIISKNNLTVEFEIKIEHP